MKIVIATPLYPPEPGGPATYVKILEDGLQAHGIDVVVVKFSDVRHKAKLFRHHAFYKNVLAAAQDADLVLALDPVSVGLPSMQAAKRAKKPFVVKVVGDYAWEQGTQRFGVTQTLDEFVRTKKVPFAVQFLRFVQEDVVRQAKLVIVPSQYLFGVLRAWGVPDTKISVIYNAVSVEGAGTVPATSVKLASPRIVSAGRLVPWKGMRGLIDAVALVRKKISSASLTIVGDGPERQALQAHAEKTLETGFVCTGELSHPDTLATIKSADVIVLNSSYEGLAHLLIESVMLGIPAVATNAGGNREVIKDGVNGFLVPVGDSVALADAIGKVCADPGLRAKLSAGASSSSGEFSLERMLRSTAETLKKMV